MISSVGSEHYLDRVGVTGSNPVSPTTFFYIIFLLYIYYLSKKYNIQKNIMKYLNLIFVIFSLNSFAQNFDQQVNDLIEKNLDEIIELRHWFHQNAELSNREFKTSQRIAEELRKIGYKPQTGIAKTGVVAILNEGKPGPVVGLRADIDGLPVKERADIPWASKMTGEYNGEIVPVMHACGHDTHTAILLATAKILYKLRNQIPGQVKFIFQPAEEGAPNGEEGGAELMVKEGVLKNPDVDAIFGLHKFSDNCWKCVC